MAATPLNVHSFIQNWKPNKALYENSSLSYGASPAIWDHTVLNATRHKWTRSTLTPASKLILDLPTPDGWKAELTYPAMHRPGVELATSRSQVRRPTTTLPSHAPLSPVPSVVSWTSFLMEISRRSTLETLLITFHLHPTTTSWVIRTP